VETEFKEQADAHPAANSGAATRNTSALSQNASPGHPNRVALYNTPFGTQPALDRHARLNCSKPNERKKDGRDISGASTKSIRLTDLIPSKSINGGSQVIFGPVTTEST
jgi:hypothetical protein